MGPKVYEGGGVSRVMSTIAEQGRMLNGGTLHDELRMGSNSIPIVHAEVTSIVLKSKSAPLLLYTIQISPIKSEEY